MCIYTCIYILSSDDGHIECDFNEKNGCELSQDESFFVWEMKEENGGMFIAIKVSLL